MLTKADLLFLAGFNALLILVTLVGVYAYLTRWVG